MTSENELRKYLGKVFLQLPQPTTSSSRPEHVIRVSLFPFTSYKPFAAQTYTRLRIEYGKNLGDYKEWRTTVMVDKTQFDIGERDGIRFKTNYLSDYSDPRVLDEYGLSILVTSEEELLPPGSKFNAHLPDVETTNPVVGFRIPIGQNVTFKAETEGDSYRFYVELKQVNATAINDLMRACRMFRDTAHLYTKSEYSNVVREFLRIVGLDVPSFQGVPYIPSTVFYHARDMTYDDILNGNILNQVRIGYKTDGFRRALYCRNNEIWLLYANSASLVSLKNGLLSSGMILDGEYVPAYKRNARIIEQNHKDALSAFHYVAYDVLAYPGRNPPASTHRERLDLLPPAGNLITIGSLAFIRKQFYDFATSEQLSKRVKSLEELLADSIYHTDGYIFISNRITYTYTGKGNRPNAVADKYTILKWKHRRSLTMDLKIRPLASGLYEPMGIDNVHPVDLSDLAETIPADAIVEFHMEDIAPEGEINFKLVADRLRTDKDKPNTADEISRLIMLFRDPITIDVLRGESMRTVQHFHQREYQYLITTGIARISTKPKYCVHLGIPSCFTNNAWMEMLDEFEKVIVLDLHGILVPSDSYSTWPKYDAKIVVVGSIDLAYAAAEALFPDGQSHVITSLFSPVTAPLESLGNFIDKVLHPQGAFLWAQIEGGALCRYFSLSSSIKVEANNRILYNLLDNNGTAYKSYVANDEGIPLTSPQAANLPYVLTPYVYVSTIADSLFAKSTTQRLGSAPFLNSYEHFYSGLFTSAIYEEKTAYTPLFVDIIEDMTTSIEDQEITSNIEEEEPSTEIGEASGGNVVAPLRATQGRRQFVKPATTTPTERHDAAHTLPLALLRRFIGPFAVVGYHRHVAGVETEYLQGLYAALLGSFFQGYYGAPRKYVAALTATYGEPSIHILAYELRLSIILVTVLNELIDQVILEGRPVVVLCIAFDRVTQRRYYEIVSHAQDRGARTLYETVFSPQDSFVTARRIVSNVDITEEPWLVRLPSVRRALIPKSGTTGTYNIASNDLAGILRHVVDDGTYDTTDLQLALGASRFEEDVPYFVIGRKASLAIFLASVSDAVNHPRFVLGWSGQRFDDYHIALLMAISNVFDLTLLFDSAYNVWLVGQTSASETSREELSNYIASLGTQRAALDLATLSRNVNLVGVIRSILQRVIEIYRHS